MTGFDMAALLFVGLGAATGFVRGFVQEVLALSAWIFAIFAIRILHTPLTYQLEGYLGDSSSVSILAFALLLLVPYIVVKMVAKWAGSQSRKSVLGPIDRVLGFGFGAMKGIIIIVLAFSVLMLGYDTVWGVAGRPDWVTQSRTYPFINASSEAMVQMISERRTAMLNEGEGT
ncbi:CvpA family protein [Novosphingobium sp. BW1]|uniref:CvpA family protein n=1 Tax=Novosphingobium sp. BW1 TaxID=2592621 RepID=UPI0011DE7B82|nr:CvpA family protein [Novosphingobium sp. BW1]TYC90824.1 CvpA family protein [Novosphingobium sp. BW1]